MPFLPACDWMLNGREMSWSSELLAIDGGLVVGMLCLRLSDQDSVCQVSKIIRNGFKINLIERARPFAVSRRSIIIWRHPPPDLRLSLT
jgi:hypothetical protein